MSKVLVAYFSAGGVTAEKAKHVAKAAGADLFEIKPAVPYTKEDLDWHNKDSRTSVEMKDKTFRPEIAGKLSDISGYDTIFLGFPIWWYTAPLIVWTFLESYDFSGKTIIPFATSDGTKLGKSLQDIKSCVSDSTVVKEGKMMSNMQPLVIARWVQEQGFSAE